MSSAPTPEQKQRFFELLELPTSARQAELARLETSDAELATRLRKLIRAHQRAESALGGLDSATWSEPDDLQVGDRLGPYRLERELGEGGFGRVWLAEQSEPVRRSVALKVLKAGMDSREVVARFQAERQALARMEHPGIAKVYDAGQTERGRLWFAMEYVHGAPITEYCDTHRLDLQSRLGLFAAVCRAVQHAHTKGVVHRDLKPNNVLVTEIDGAPQPKVIDFGIAKAIAEPLTPSDHRTVGGQWIGTPAFMAPEQLELAGDVDTRTDVYSLGALLQVSLTGSPPFPKQPGTTTDWHVRIRNERPARPSTHVGTTAHVQRPGVTRQALRRELDWIIARCLEKDPDRRYDSAAVLGNELDRVLLGEPVLAGPPGMTYRLTSFVRRNRVSLMLATSIFVLLFVALLFALDRESRAVAAELAARESAATARASEQQARDELARSQAVARLTEHMLLSVKPSVARGSDTSLMVEMLERAEAYILNQGTQSAATEADLARMVGGAWWELGEYQRALPHFERALQWTRESAGPSSPEALAAASTLGTHLLTFGDLARAESLLRECFDAYPLESNPTSSTALTNASSYAEVLFKREQLEAALAIRLRIVEAAAQTLAPGHIDMLMYRNNLASSLEALRRFEEAGDQYRSVLALQLADPSLGPDHPHTLMTRGNLSGLLREQGRIDEAREMSSEVLAAKRRVLPPGHISLLTSLNNLGELEKQSGNLERAEELLREALDLAQSNLGPQSEPVRILSLNLARVCLELERYADVIERLEPIVRGTDPVQPPSHLTLYCDQALCNAYLHVGQFEAVLSITDRAIDAAREVFTDSTAVVGTFSVLRGTALANSDRAAEAEAALITGYEQLRGGREESVGWRRRAAQQLADHFTATGHPDQAATWQARADAEAVASDS